MGCGQLLQGLKVVGMNKVEWTTTALILAEKKI